MGDDRVTPRDQIQRPERIATRKTASRQRTGSAYEDGGQARAKRSPLDSVRSAASSVSSSVGNRVSRVRGSSSSASGSRTARTSARTARTVAGQPAASGSDYLGEGPSCKRCGRPVDPSQTRCPHCGAFVRPPYKNPVLIGALAIIVVLIVVFCILINSCSSAPQAGEEPTPQVTATEASTNELQTTLDNARQYLSDNATGHVYTAASIQDLEAATSAAQALLTSQNYSTEEAEAATQAINDSMNSLVILTSFSLLTDPWYDPLMADIDSYMGQQISMSGIIQTITTSDNMATALVFISGDEYCPVFVQYGSLTAVDTGIVEGSSIRFGGTVTSTLSYTLPDGNSLNAPYVVADYLYLTEEI